MDGQALADFLRARRAAAAPPDAASAGLRKVPGLRRQEVAELAGISADYYTRLEQNRTSRPSASVVAALAGALRLTTAQRAHLFRLAEQPVPPEVPRSDDPDPVLLRVLEQLDAVPAHLMTELGVTLAQNGLSRALFGDATRYEGAARSTFYRWFTDPAARLVFSSGERERETRSRVAELRATVGRRADAASAALVERLLADSAEFATLWRAHEVGTRYQDRKLLLGPTGELELFSQFVSAGAPGQLLVVFTPVPGTAAAERLAALRR